MNTDNFPLLTELQSSRGTIKVRKIDLVTKGSCATSYKKYSLQIKYSGDHQLSDIYSSLKTVSTFDVDLASLAVIKCLEILQIQSEIIFGSTRFTVLNKDLKTYVLDFFAIMDITYGSDKLPKGSDIFADQSLILSILAYSLLPVRLSSYREEGILLRQEVKNRLYNLLLQHCKSSNELIEKIKIADQHFVPAFNSSQLLFLTSLIDLIIISDPTVFILPIRIVSITTFHMDNTVLLKFLQILSYDAIDVDFFIKSIVLETVGLEAEELLDPIHNIFEQRNLIAYMRGFNLVQKSLFSASEMPHLHVLCSTLLALFIDSRLFKSVMLRPDSEGSIVLAYLIYRDHQRTQSVQQFFVDKTKIAPIKRNFKSIEDKENRLDHLRKRLLRGVGLTEFELTDLKNKSRPYSDRQRSIAAFILEMTPIEVDISINPKSSLNESISGDLNEFIE